MTFNKYLLIIGVLFLLATMIMARAFDQDHEESPLDEPRFSARDFLEVLMQKRVFRPNNTRYNFDKIVVHMTTSA
jgi:hypothetical protein